MRTTSSTGTDPGPKHSATGNHARSPHGQTTGRLIRIAGSAALAMALGTAAPCAQAALAQAVRGQSVLAQAASAESVRAQAASAESAQPTQQSPPVPQNSSTQQSLQTQADPRPQVASNTTQQAKQPGAGKPEAGKPETHMSRAQAKQLFAMVDELLHFASADTGLAIKTPVKRRLTTRAEVEHYLRKKFNEDQAEQRMERDEILLKKFGMLDRDFALRPFLLDLLTEQIEGYYDDVTRTVNLLDWVDADQQKPVMAHELTHALQDQHVGLEKWSDQTPSDVSTTGAADAEHLRKDEWDTAREAVTEGQAMAVMTDYILKPLGKSVTGDPEDVARMLEQSDTDNASSPVMARAPLLLAESMMFPYREGMSFEQDVWMEKGRDAAFAGALDQPPASSWEVINPLDYMARKPAPIPLLPDIHPLVDALYAPYDIGQIGQLDLKILSRILGGESASQTLTPAWDGGIYWAGQMKSAQSPAEKSSTRSLALFYLSAWKSEGAAREFVRLYGQSLGRKYSGVQAEPGLSSGLETSQIYSTAEGPVILTQRGKWVFVSESFPRELALRLTGLVLDAQGSGPVQVATTAAPAHTPTSELTHLMSSYGVLKCVVDHTMRSAAGLSAAKR